MSLDLKTSESAEDPEAKRDVQSGTAQHATTACPPTFTDLQYYFQIVVLAVTTLLCLGAIIADPTGPNVRYFQSVATFCIGLVLPNPRQSVGPSP